MRMVIAMGQILMDRTIFKQYHSFSPNLAFTHAAHDSISPLYFVSDR